MNILESFRVALSSLFANKMRSLLTMLGVIIGVGSVITMISIVQGAQKKILDEVGSNGATLLFGSYSPKGESQRRTTFSGLRMADIEAIQRRVGSIESISPEQSQSVKSLYGSRTFSGQAKGIVPEYQDINNVAVAQGRFVELGDGESWAKVCVIGDNVRKELFPDTDGLGRQIVIVQNEVRLPLTVVGIMEHKERSGFGENSDDQIYLPLQTMQKRLAGNDIIGSFNAKAREGISPNDAADEVFAVLKSRHPENAQDFVVDTLDSILKQINTFAVIFQIVLGGVCGLSLLVGGIGIMNIMLVSVTERTREIGIRKAIGAKQRDILIQFVTESMTVSGMGGLLGVGFGYGVAQLVGRIAGDKMPPPYVPLWAVALGFGFAVSVGMFFGIYPAYRAAKLDPIQALRYE